MDRWPKRPDRHSLGRRQRRADAGAREGTDRSAAGRDPRQHYSGDRCAPAGTRTIPIVFVIVADPVGSRVRCKPAAPGRQYHRLQLMKKHQWQANGWSCSRRSRPPSTRVAIIFNPDTAPAVDPITCLHSRPLPRSLRVEPIVRPFSSDAEIERAITALGREPGGGLVVMTDGFVLRTSGANYISGGTETACQRSIGPTFAGRRFTRIWTGPSSIYRRAGPYIDRILRGAKPADLPVAAAGQFHLVLNTKTAKSLGLTVPPSILLRADEVIE